jgi:hypothetical protein
VLGAEWEKDIDKYLASAKIVLLLISSDFLASDYCYEKEMQTAMARHDKGEARVVPIILRAVDWKESPFGKLQALPKDAKPVANWESLDEAFTSVAQAIRQVVKDLSATTNKSSPQRISESLKKFDLRPKKYSGQEFVADAGLEDAISKIDEAEAEAFSLPLGDAIRRRFIVKPDMKCAAPLFAAGKLADWLEEAPVATYRLRVRLIYGTYEDILFGVNKERPASGFQLMEVIEIIADSQKDPA